MKLHITALRFNTQLDEFVNLVLAFTKMIGYGSTEEKSSTTKICYLFSID